MDFCPLKAYPPQSRACIDAHLQELLACWIEARNRINQEKWSVVSIEAFLLVMELKFWLSHALGPSRQLAIS